MEPRTRPDDGAPSADELQPADEIRPSEPSTGRRAGLLDLLGGLHLVVPAPPADWDHALAGPMPVGTGPVERPGEAASASADRFTPDQQGVGRSE